MEDSGIGIAGATNSQPNLPSPEVPALELAPSFEVGNPGDNASVQSSSMTQSIDDFTHVSPVRSMTSSITKSLYCQVIFHDVCDIYTTDSDIKCRYTLTSGVTAQPGDKVALFKVGWDSVSEYHTFVSAAKPTNEETSLSVTLKAEHLPKDESNLYQVCYVTSGNVIAGASTPFTFHIPTETELIAIEDPSDPGMIVFKSRVSKLQDDLRKKSDDCEQFALKQKVLEENMVLLKNELDKADTELKTYRDKIAELFTDKQNLEIDNKILDERLQQFKLEADAFEKLQEELKVMKSSKEALKEEVAEAISRYEGLKQLFEEDSKSFLNLKMENLELGSNMNQHFETLQEKNRMIEGLTSTVKCLQQDCERTTRALKEQVKMVDSLTTQHEQLSEEMGRLGAERDVAVTEKMDLSRKNELLQKENIRILQLLQDTFDAACGADVNVAKVRQLQEENELLQAQLMGLEDHHAKCEKKIEKLTNELRRCGQNPEDLDATSSIFEMVRSAASNIVPRIIPQFPGPEPVVPARNSPESGDELHKKLHDLRSSKSELSNELVISRHRESELNEVLSELKQESSRKKNRIEVLELELRASNEELAKLRKIVNLKADSADPLEAFSCGLPVIQKFNEQVSLLSQLQKKLDAEQSGNAALKKKIEDLLDMDAKRCCDLEDMQKKYKSAKLEIVELKSLSYERVSDHLGKALDNSQSELKMAESKLARETERRIKAEKQVAALRAESVGKISVDSCRKMQETINTLQNEHRDMTKFCDYMKKFIFFTFEGEEKSINCPLCPSVFSASSKKQFAVHFQNNHMN